MRLAVGLLLVVGCQPPADDYPINPGGAGGKGGSTGGADAAIDGNDGGSFGTIQGRVCVVTDLRTPKANCATGVAGLLVTLAGKTATTDDTGAFAIDTPSGSNLVWHVTGAGLMTSVMPFGPQALIPATSVNAYGDLLTSNGAILQGGQGSIVANVVNSQGAIAGAKVALATPQSEFGPFYDSNDASTWDRNVTGVFGTLWLAGDPLPTVSVRVTTPLGGDQTIVLPVEDGAITFATFEFP